MKPLVIYHANCADGFGAAFAAWLKLGDDAEYLPMKHNDIDTQLDYTGRDLYILDFSFPREVMERMLANAKKVVWLDHHKTAFEMWCATERELFTLNDTSKHVVWLDNNKSGAMLAWEYFHPNTEIPMLIQHIDDYDRWQFKLNSTRAFIKSLWSRPFEFKAWQSIFFSESYTENAYVCAYKEGDAILRAHEQNVQNIVKSVARKCRIWLHKSQLPGDEHATNPLNDHIELDGLVANCPAHLASDVGHKLANQSSTYGLLWYMDKEGKINCSLRSNGVYDVSVIAKAFGGGGHKNAAGFEIDLHILLTWL